MHRFHKLLLAQYYLPGFKKAGSQAQKLGYLILFLNPYLWNFTASCKMKIRFAMAVFCSRKRLLSSCAGDGIFNGRKLERY